jgi:hypothetical protein
MPILASFGGANAIGRGVRGGGRKVVIVPISTQNNYTANTAKITGYEPGNTDAIFTIAGGVTIGSASTG